MFSVQEIVGEIGEWKINVSFDILRLAVVPLLLYFLVSWIRYRRYKSKFSGIPRLYFRDKTWFDRLMDPFNLLIHAKETVLKGYTKFPTSFFRVSLLNYPSGVVVVDRSHLKEYFDDSEKSFDFISAALEDIDFEHTLSGDIHNIYHIPVIRNQLTQNIVKLTPIIAEELDVAFESEIGSLLGDGPPSLIWLISDWTPIVIYEKALRLVAQMSNRAFVGESLSRNAEYLEACIQNATHVAQFGQLLVFFPKFLRPIVSYLFFPLPRSEKIAKKYLCPMIDARRAGTDEKSSDLIQWLMDSANSDYELRTDQLALRILMVNFAAIHTSSIGFTHAIYDLAARPEYLEPLRQEVESLISEFGWQKSTVMKMKKLDSFIKECFRFNAGGMSVFRKVMKPYTFSNGVTIPAGATLGTAAGAIHMDDNIYPNAKEFNGLRFSDIREKEGENAKLYCANTGPDFLVFGHGEHACPGRFFAVHEIKMMLAFVLLRYDIRTEDGKRPENIIFGNRTLPNMRAKILFKRRELLPN